MSNPGLLALAMPLAFVVSAALLGCSGNIIAEGAPGATTGSTGTAGAGGATTSSGTWSTSGTTTWSTSGTTSSSTSSTSSGTWTTTGTADCQQLGDAYDKALTAGSDCAVCGTNGCAQGVIYTDTCNCNVLLDGNNASALSDTKLAYWSWKSAGCIPPPGCTCPPVSGLGPHCSPWGPKSCGGTCSL